MENFLSEWPRRVKRGPNKGYSNSPTYRIWQGIGKRCYRPQASNYHLYGGRGIRFCTRWENFENFLSDMGERPSSEYSLERRDYNGHYTPQNCRWATVLEQAGNKRNNRMITANGKTQCISAWIRELNISPSTFKDRIYKLGWDEVRAVTTPPAKRVWKARVSASRSISHDGR